MSRRRDRSRSSSTPGKSKGENCHRSQLKNLFSKDSRLYRTNPILYLAACREISKLKGNLPTIEVIEDKQARNA